MARSTSRTVPLDADVNGLGLALEAEAVAEASDGLLAQVDGAGSTGEVIEHMREIEAAGRYAITDPVLRAEAERRLGVGAEADRGGQALWGPRDAAAAVLIENERLLAEAEAAARKKAPKKTDDQKRADFSRLASARASAALKAMITLGSLANTAQYLWDADQEEALIGALDAKVVELGDMFAAARAPSGGDGRRRPKQLLIKV